MFGTKITKKKKTPNDLHKNLNRLGLDGELMVKNYSYSEEESWMPSSVMVMSRRR